MTPTPLSPRYYVLTYGGEPTSQLYEDKDEAEEQLAARNKEFPHDQEQRRIVPLYVQPVSQPGEALPAFAKGSWQHAVDDALVPYMKTSHDFATPHDAVKWLLQITAEAAGEALPAEQPKSDKSYAVVAVDSDIPPALSGSARE